MTSVKSRLRERLARQPTLLGLLQTRPNPLLIEMAGECGYDFLILDGQRGVFSEREFHESMVSLVAASNVISMARLAGHDLQALRQCIEEGVDTIVVPQVTTAEEAAKLARAMHSNTQASLIVILESVLGVMNAGEILAVEGVTGAFVGPINLSTELGDRGNYANPSFMEALARMERAAAVSGKLLGTVPHEGYSIEMLIPRGHRLFILGGDQILLRNAMSAQVARAKASTNPAPVNDLKST